MDLEKAYISEELKTVSCSICLDLVLHKGERSTARLQCGHDFHLDCIGSAFNAKGAMQCPNCRKVEKGQWLYSNGYRSSSDFDFDGWITEDIYDLSYSELPLGYQWCPFDGFTQLTSSFEDMESQPNYYHEPMGIISFGEHSSASVSSHICPYQALHGFPHHPMSTQPSIPSDSVSENSHFHPHLTGLGGQPPAEVHNLHSLTEPPGQNWPQQPPPLPVPVAANSDQSTFQYRLMLSRNDTNNPQRIGTFVHPHPPHGSISSRSASNLRTGSIAPPVHGEVRTHSRGNASHIYHQSISSSPPQSSHFPPNRRSRPRGVAVISTTSSTDIGGFHGFSVSTSTNRSLQDSGRVFDRYYGWGREGFAPLPWIPLEGESRWWGPFNPNQAPQSGSFAQRGGTNNERAVPSRPENRYNHPRMPPPPL
ncbi:uncharacterized protein LOC110024438 [Phalaenopsis equestris]|uniref:uncharacterized protein LOC110024438 n=1 Tax=Phalaenopsis equestris TaxID=78828 RepID=UPI0009E2E2EF|nr:uncharacterized protein LOC110024438 [Phalaenopsis equestris]